MQIKQQMRNLAMSVILFQQLNTTGNTSATNFYQLTSVIVKVGSVNGYRNTACFILPTVFNS